MIVFGNILNAVKHMHDNNVCHRYIAVELAAASFDFFFTSLLHMWTNITHSLVVTVFDRNLFLDNIFIFGDPNSLLFLKLSGFSNAKSADKHSQPNSM